MRTCTLTLKTAAFGIVLASILCPGCGFHPQSSCGVVNATRCNTNRVDLCGPNGHWITALDCSAMGLDWTCQVKDANHTCVKGSK